MTIFNHRQPSRREVLAGLAAAGLAPNLLTLAEAAAQGIAPKRGGTLTTILSPEPPILVLGVNNQGPTLVCASKIYQSLLKFSPKLEPLPQLAKSWTLSEDKRSYTFHLQDNVKWHDGKPFTADAPFEPFLLMFEVTAAAMMPKHIYDGTDFRNNPANQKPIGTGPFQFVEWQRGNFIRLARFEGYWKPGQPYLDEIIYRIVPDSQSRALALQTGQVLLTQASDIEPFDVPRFREQANLTVETKGWEYFSPLSWIETNHRVKPLDDKRVRQAISHAIDRDFIVQRLWFGVGKPATSPIASTTRFYDPASKLQAHDPRAATQLLDAAGLKPNAQGIRFSVKHLVLPYGEVWSRLSEYLRTSLRQVGIELVLESTDAGAWARRVGDWDYETTI